MNYIELYKKIEILKIGETISIYKESDIEMFVVRPVSKFKDYDEKKNFQIFLKEGEREFRPNHLRIMIDLHLRVRSRQDLKIELLKAFDKIYKKENSFEAIKKIENENFEHYLNSLKVIAILDQLFLIEQELNYTKESNYDPVTLFYQGWIRQSIDSSKEIDNLVMSICRFQPPASKYTFKNNKKHKKFGENAVSLWYLED